MSPGRARWVPPLSGCRGAFGPRGQDRRGTAATVPPPAGPAEERVPRGSPPQTPPSVPADTPRDRQAAERRSPGHGAEPVGTVPGRSRTKFSAAQLQELERSFREQRYIRAGEKQRLAAVLNLSQSQVSAASPSAAPGHGPRGAGRHLTVTGGRGSGCDSDSSCRCGGPGCPPASPAGANGLEQTDSPASPGTAVPVAAPSPPETRCKWKIASASSKAATSLGVKVTSTISRTSIFRIILSYGYVSI